MKIRDAFENWAQKQGLRPIRTAADAAVGTTILLKRKGRYVVETHVALGPSQKASIDAGFEHGYEYPFGVRALAEDDLKSKMGGAS